MVQYTENVPEGWSIKQIKDIAPLQRGFDLPSKELVGGEYPVCYSNGVGNFHNEYKVKGPGVFTGRSGTIGNVFFVEEDFWPHNTSLWVTDFKDNDEKYVYYLYQSIKLNRFNAGTGVPTLNRNDVHSYKVLIPNEAVEQKRIADIIGIWDKAIELKEKLIEQKKEQKKGLMQRLLTGKIRLEGFKEPWEKVQLGKIATIVMGQSPKSDSYNELEEGIPLIQGNADIKNRRTLPRNWTTNPTKICHPNDILMTVRAPVGSIALSEHEACLGRGVCAIQANINSDYLYYQLIRRENMWGKIAQGSTFESINSNDIKELIIEVPIQEEQIAIAKVLKVADKHLSLLKRELEELYSQKQALMQQLLTGKIRVKV